MSNDHNTQDEASEAQEAALDSQAQSSVGEPDGVIEGLKQFMTDSPATDNFAYNKSILEQLMSELPPLPEPPKDFEYKRLILAADDRLYLALERDGDFKFDAISADSLQRLIVDGLKYLQAMGYYNPSRAQEEARERQSRVTYH